MTKFIIKKEELLKTFKKVEFPEISLSKNDTNLIKDLLFNETSEEPLILNDKRKFSTCFMKDISSNPSNSTFKPRSASSFKPNSNITRKFNNNEENQKKENTIQRVLIPQNPKKISDERNLNSSEFLLCRENSISISNSNLIEYIPQPNQLNLNKDLSFIVNFANKDSKNEDNKIIKGRKFSECSDSSSKNINYLNYLL